MEEEFYIKQEYFRGEARFRVYRRMDSEYIEEFDNREGAEELLAELMAIAFEEAETYV